MSDTNHKRSNCVETILATMDNAVCVRACVRAYVRALSLSSLMV